MKAAQVGMWDGLPFQVLANTAQWRAEIQKGSWEGSRHTRMGLWVVTVASVLVMNSKHFLLRSGSLLQFFNRQWPRGAGTVRQKMTSTWLYSCCRFQAGENLAISTVPWEQHLPLIKCSFFEHWGHLAFYRVTELKGGNNKVNGKTS